VAGPSVFVRTPTSGAAAPAGSSVQVSAYVASPDGVASVKAKLGSGAYVAATKGAGNVWTATVPTKGLAAGKAVLTVSATDAAGTPATATATKSVTISAPKGNLAKGSYAWSDKTVKKTGKWKAYNTSASPTKKGIQSSKKNSKATAKVFGKQVVVTFTKGAKAGKVKVTVDGKSTTYDLYAKKTANLKKTFKLGGAVASHTVTVTVLGSKNAKSKGTTVSLAALQVK
jgi:hypothetical protein